MPNTPSRRAILASALAAPVGLAASPSLASEHGARTIPAAWRDLILQCARLHSTGHLAAERAYARGMDIEAFSGFSIASGADGETVPRLTFGPWWDYEAPYFIVTPDAVGRYEPEPALKRLMEARPAPPA